MAKGCLAALFGIGVQRGSEAEQSIAQYSACTYVGGSMARADEGNLHSGPGGYEDASYKGGYAADYFAEETQDYGHEEH